MTVVVIIIINTITGITITSSKIIILQIILSLKHAGCNVQICYQNRIIKDKPRKNNCAFLTEVVLESDDTKITLIKSKSLEHNIFNIQCSDAKPNNCR